jgi:hypothetical protein
MSRLRDKIVGSRRRKRVLGSHHSYSPCRPSYAVSASSFLSAPRPARAAFGRADREREGCYRAHPQPKEPNPLYLWRMAFAAATGWNRMRIPKPGFRGTSGTTLEPDTRVLLAGMMGHPGTTYHVMLRKFAMVMAATSAVDSDSMSSSTQPIPFRLRETQ